MNILLLGDIVGPAGRKAVVDKLPYIIKKKELDFVIVNGENAADPGVGITKQITKEFLVLKPSLFKSISIVDFPFMKDETVWGMTAGCS